MAKKIILDTLAEKMNELKNRSDNLTRENCKLRNKIAMLEAKLEDSERNNRNLRLFIRCMNDAINGHTDDPNILWGREND